MKKEKDTALKNLLNLKEDYILDLDKYKDSENLSFKEDEKDEPEKKDKEETDNDETAEEEDNDASAEETDDDETEEESEEDEDPKHKKIVEPEKEPKDKPQKPESKYLKVAGLPEVFNAMKKAESAADVGISLKKFLTIIRQSSVEALVKTKNEKEPEKEE